MELGTYAYDAALRKFTGKERDSESNLDNFGARFDSSFIGRFMSPDTGGFHIEDPQSLGRYAYVLNNPLRFVDPDGRDPLDPAVLEQLKHFDQIVDQRVKQIAYDYLVSHTSMVVSARVGTALGQIASPSDSVVHGGYLNLTSAEQDELSSSIANRVEAWIEDPKTTIDQLKSAAWDVDGMLESLKVPDALTFFLSMKQQLALLLASSPRERLLKKLQEDLEDSIRRKQEEEEQRKRREAECANDPKKCPDNPGVPQPATTGPSL